ncbi:MAG: short chain dehydrogenase [Alphaproteobacteria bacterium 64-11]|nr:SDR family oxidoreductase [Alphaproteobacteria bacterium]OJU14010.1 MAG: short chain dehydrogenase [Alphaproteobacteria bacterium 64-11]
MRNVLVTGAAKRLGRAIALDLAADGWNVVIHYHGSEEDADSAAQAVRAFGMEAAVVKCDLSKEPETEHLIERAAAELGPLTALINSASLFEDDEWNSVTRKSWDDHIETNLRAPFVLAQHFARQIPDDAGGNIINIIDQRVLKPTPQFLSYSLSKAALYWLTTTLAQAMAPRIRVNAVGPGPTIRNARQSEADFARQQCATILGRGAAPADICAAIRYLLSAEAVTGQMLAVDGGQHLIWKTPDVQVRE